MVVMMFRLPRIAWHLSRGGVLGHLARTGLFPPWFSTGLEGLDRMIARPVKASTTNRLASALTALGPGFVKFGQALSTRGDLIGADAAKDLAQLQDQLPPFKTAIARQIITDQLGQDIDVLFRSFDDTPVAAASIAQVHFAKLHDGRAVAVKILRPGIRAKLERDIDFFASIARLLEWVAPRTKRLKLKTTVDQFAHYADVELDLRLEGSSAAKLKENHSKDEGIYVPSIEWGLTTEQVLVMERVAGTRIDDRAALLASGHVIDDITTIAAKSFFFQVFRDGFFHGDMHPGNIFIRGDGVLVPIDFGIMGHLSVTDRLFLAQLLSAILDRDYAKVAQLHRGAGMIPLTVNLADFAQAIRAAVEPIMDKPMGGVSLGAVLGQIFGLAQRYDVEVQPQFTLLQKTMVMAEGVGRQLNPDANMWPIARDLAAEWAEDQGGWGGGWRMQINTIADKTLSFGLRLPELMDRAETLLDRMESPENKRKSNHYLPWFIAIAAIIIAISAFFVN